MGEDENGDVAMPNVAGGWSDRLDPRARTREGLAPCGRDELEDKTS